MSLTWTGRYATVRVSPLCIAGLAHLILTRFYHRCHSSEYTSDVRVYANKWRPLPMLSTPRVGARCGTRHRLDMWVGCGVLRELGLIWYYLGGGARSDKNLPYRTGHGNDASAVFAPSRGGAPRHEGLLAGRGAVSRGPAIRPWSLRRRGIFCSSGIDVRVPARLYSQRKRVRHTA